MLSQTKLINADSLTKLQYIRLHRLLLSENKKQAYRTSATAEALIVNPE